MGELSVAVVGAGIGGLTAALALSAHGHPVTLIERRPGFSEVGVGLQLSPNASRILIDLGLSLPLRRVATEPDRVVIRSMGSGARIGEVALGRFMRERFGAPYWLVHRADLQTILLDAVRSRRNIRIAMGRAVENVIQTKDGAVLDLSRQQGGRETTQPFDLVIGADGLWSKVRHALGDVENPSYRGFVAWRSTIAPEEAPPELRGNETGLWLGRDVHLVHYPIAAGRLLNVVAIERRPLPVEGWATRGDGAELLAHLAGASPAVKTLLSAPKEWLLWSLFDHPAKTLIAGRVALLGDAAHPVLPFLAQGAALAIEDAAALARLLKPSDVPGSLREYAAQRQKRVARVQDHARRNGMIYHLGGLPAFARNQVMRHLGAEGMAKRYAWLYGYADAPSLAQQRAAR